MIHKSFAQHNIDGWTSTQEFGTLVLFCANLSLSLVFCPPHKPYSKCEIEIKARRKRFQQVRDIKTYFSRIIPMQRFSAFDQARSWASNDRQTKLEYHGLACVTTRNLWHHSNEGSLFVSRTDFITCGGPKVSREFKFVDGNFNISTSSRLLQFTHGNFIFFTATLTVFFASLTTCKLRRPHAPKIKTKNQNRFTNTYASRQWVDNRRVYWSQKL